MKAGSFVLACLVCLAGAAALLVRLREAGGRDSLSVRLVPEADAPIRSVVCAVDAMLMAHIGDLDKHNMAVFGNEILLVPPAAEKPAEGKAHDAR
jgi:hypothetical protein